jgi:hypothetical protein
VPEKRRIVLRIEPHTAGGGRFDIWYGDYLIVTTDTRAEAEEAIRIWQAEADAGEAPSSRTIGLEMMVMDAEIRALRAEIGTLRAARDHVAISSRGGENSQEARREDIEQWVAVAERIGKAERLRDDTSYAKDIADLVIEECKARGIECPKHRRLEGVLSDLVTKKEMLPRRKTSRARKK